MKKVLRALFYLFFPIFIGGIVGFLISSHIDYTSLVKPPFAPPKLAFPIAWSIIYLLMGISYFLWRREEEDFSFSFLYYVQLFVNAFWSIIFFVWKWRFISILWILLLDGLVLYLVYQFWERKKISAYLNFPYVLWILFATYLTIGIYILN